MNRSMLVLAIAIALLVPLYAQSSLTPFFLNLPDEVLNYAVGANGWTSVGVIRNRLFCVPFSFCQRSLSTFQFGGGAQLRF